MNRIKSSKFRKPAFRRLFTSLISKLTWQYCAKIVYANIHTRTYILITKLCLQCITMARKANIRQRWIITSTGSCLNSIATTLATFRPICPNRPIPINNYKKLIGEVYKSILVLLLFTIKYHGENMCRVDEGLTTK